MSRTARGALVLLVAAGVAVILVNSRGRLGGVSDADVYIGVARNLAHGRGLTVPFTTYSDRYRPAHALAHYGKIPLEHFPPLYPMVLAVGDASPWWSRTVNALAFGVVLTGIMLLVVQIVGPSLWLLGLCAGLVALVSPGPLVSSPWPIVWSFVASEPLFMALTVAALATSARYLARPSSRLLWCATGFGAAAALTRYIGISVPLATATVVAVWGAASWRRRLRDAAVLLGGLIPVVGFLAIQRARGVAARTLVHHAKPGMTGALRFELTTWLGAGSNPNEATTWAVNIAVLTLVGLLAIKVSRRRNDLPTATIRVLLTFGVVYPVSLWFAVTWLDASTPLDGRLLGPIRIVLYTLVFAGPAYLLERRSVPSRVFAVGAVAVAIGVAAPAVHTRFDAIRHHPAEPNTVEQLRGAMRHVPRSAFVVTDTPDAVYELTGRPALLVPTTAFPVTRQGNSHYQQDVAELARLIRTRHGVLVGSLEPSFLFFVPSVTDLAKQLGLHELFRDGSYAVFGAEPSARGRVP